MVKIGTLQRAGTLSLMQSNGAGFNHAYASGFLGSLGAAGFVKTFGQEIAGSTVGTIAFGAVSGGVGASLTGGNFWQGFVIGGTVSALNHVGHRIRTSQETRTYSLPGTTSAPDGNLPIHQQQDPEVGCTQEVMESIIEYKTGQVLNLDKSAGADFMQLSKTDALKSLNLNVSNSHNDAFIIGTEMLKGNPSAITYDNNGTFHTVAVNKITITHSINSRGVGSMTYTIQVMIH
jgi:hypothetical protein